MCFPINSRIQIIIYHNWSSLPLETRQTSRSFCATIQPLNKLFKACFLEFAVCFHNGFLARISIIRRVLSRTKSKPCSKITEFQSQKFRCPFRTCPLTCCVIKNCRLCAAKKMNSKFFRVRTERYSFYFAVASFVYFRTAFVRHVE